jgi:hypothetical protein
MQTDSKNRQQVIAVVDIPDSNHGRLMQHCVRAEAFSPAIRWIEPSLQLPEALATLDNVAAVAMPIGVKGGTRCDRFTQRLMAAIASLMERNIPVYVAAGNRQPNLLAQAGIRVSIENVPGSTSTSEACVRAAAQAAVQANFSKDTVRHR